MELMVVDALHRAEYYYGLGEGIATGLKWLRENDVSLLDPGRYELAGTECYAIVMDYVTKPSDEGVFEAHRKYIDIQFVASGVEKFGWADAAGRSVSVDYDESRDIVFLHGDGDFVTMEAGYFAVFFPHDAHMPAVAVDSPGPVRKVVVKVPF